MRHTVVHSKFVFQFAFALLMIPRKDVTVDSRVINTFMGNFYLQTNDLSIPELNHAMIDTDSSLFT